MTDEQRHEDEKKLEEIAIILRDMAQRYESAISINAYKPRPNERKAVEVRAIYTQQGKQSEKTWFSSFPRPRFAGLLTKLENSKHKRSV